MNDTVKIYGLCLERLRYQIKNAKQRIHGNGRHADKFLLECYNTGEIDDIIDILELYDVKERTSEQVKEKLDELSYTVSVLTSEALSFGFTEKGYLGLYLELRKEYADTLEETIHENM